MRFGKTRAGDPFADRAFVPLPVRHWLLALIGHFPRRSNLYSSTLSHITRWWKHLRSRWCASPVRRDPIGKLQVGEHRSTHHACSLNDSPLVRTAQAMRAFFAAMATTAFQHPSMPQSRSHRVAVLPPPPAACRVSPWAAAVALRLWH